MRTAVLDPVGIEVTDLALSDVDDDDVITLRTFLAERGVVILREQSVDDAGFEAFLRCFGALTFTAGETPLAERPHLNVISNVGRTVAPRSNFHVDTSYVRRPPAYTALRAVQIPRHGGETLFSNQYRAYDTLPDHVRTSLAGVTVTHVVTGVDLGPGDEAEADHPVLRPHPVSGRIALYLTTPQRCRAVSGMERTKAAELIRDLYAHSTRADNVYRHSWAPGDVVMWDNGCVLHRADHSDVVGDRVMHRGMVADYTGAPRS